LAFLVSSKPNGPDMLSSVDRVHAYTSKIEFLSLTLPEFPDPHIRLLWLQQMSKSDLYQATWVIIAKCHNLGYLGNKHLFLTVLKAGKLRSRCQQIGYLIKALLVYRWLHSHYDLIRLFLVYADRERLGFSYSSGTNSIIRPPALWLYP
jgi:hypothetical protein